MAQKSADRQTAREQQYEDLMIAIDQLEQVTEVIGEMLGRVKKQVAEMEARPQSSPKSREASSTVRKPAIHRKKSQSKSEVTAHKKLIH